HDFCGDSQRGVRGVEPLLRAGAEEPESRHPPSGAAARDRRGPVMTEAIRFLTSLAQALAKMSLYADGHPTRAKAADASFAQLRELQKVDATQRFSFLCPAVVYGDRAIRELSDWDWSARLSGSGIQRIEFPESVDPDEYRGFLEEILTNIALVAGGKLRAEAEQAPGRLTPIRFGAIGVRASQERSATIE